MSNIIGVVRPSVVGESFTSSTGGSVPGGVRLMAIVGEGLREEIVVSTAVGSGQDGLDETFTTTTGQDGRHFKLKNTDLVSNRHTLYKNNSPLAGLEEVPDDTVFDNRFDYRIDILTGEFELQGATLVDQGGSYYTANSLNVGTGTISTLTLEDLNAPTENWTIRCSSVRRDGYGDPIDGYAKFIAQGSVSGILLDSNGNQITWQSNGTLISNSILSFSIAEGATSFVEGDRFLIKVKGGALLKNDRLVMTYIAEGDLNVPKFFTDQQELEAKHGAASLTNRISLGSQIAFANNPPGIWTVQAAPAIPRRVSYLLEDSAAGSANLADLTFPLPLNVVPDADSGINFFVTDPVTGTESQLLPNKVSFYNSSITTSPATFCTSGSYTYSYTVILDDSVQKEGDDGVLTSVTATHATLSSASVTFDLADLSGNRTIQIYDADNALNIGIFAIVSVANGIVTINNAGGFTTESEIRFRVLDSSVTSAQILFTSDLALTLGQSIRAAVVDVKDATFFDVGWENALQALELIECDIVVPLPSQTISAIFANTVSHCRVMSQLNNAKERVAIIGAIRGLTPNNVIGTTTAAVEDLGILEGIQGDTVSEILAGNVEDLADYGVQNAYGTTFRCEYMYPDEIVVQIGADRTLVDGFFMAPALGGWYSGVANIALPATNKTLAGFTILSNKMFRPIVQDQIVSKGIVLVEPIAGGGRVVQGLTTTISISPEEQEASIIFIRDRVIKSLRLGFREYIGAVDMDGTLQGTLLGRLNSLMNSFTGKYITASKDLKVIQDATEPRQYNISAKVKPITGVNWIYIRVGFNASLA